jgi:hypothetical protein
MKRTQKATVNTGMMESGGVTHGFSMYTRIAAATTPIGTANRRRLDITHFPFQRVSSLIRGLVSAIVASFRGREQESIGLPDTCRPYRSERAPVRFRSSG